jgi:hypothetical protein
MSPKRRTPRYFIEAAGSAFQRDTNILRPAIPSNKIFHILSTNFVGRQSPRPESNRADLDFCVLHFASGLH